MITPFNSPRSLDITACLFGLQQQAVKQQPLAFFVPRACWVCMASTRVELRTLKNLLMEADLIRATTDLPEGRAVRCRERLRSALVLTDDLLGQEKLPAAPLLGRKGGSQTAKWGSDSFRPLAAKRRTRSGGRVNGVG
jgi:hypothetical protein